MTGFMRPGNFIDHAPTPGLPDGFDDGLEKALDCGSSGEEKYAFSSFSTLDANSKTVLDPLLNKGSKCLVIICWT